MKKKAEEVINPEVEKVEPGFDIAELLNNPIVGQLMGTGMDLFKKEKADPNICEISIKAPSEVVLKLFRVEK